MQPAEALWRGAVVAALEHAFSDCLRYCSESGSSWEAAGCWSWEGVATARWGLGKSWVAPEALPGFRGNCSVAGMVAHAPSFSVRSQAMVM